jgi:hypothetical protein
MIQSNNSAKRFADARPQAPQSVRPAIERESARTASKNFAGRAPWNANHNQFHFSSAFGKAMAKSLVDSFPASGLSRSYRYHGSNAPGVLSVGRGEYLVCRLPVCYRTSLACRIKTKLLICLAACSALAALILTAHASAQAQMGGQAQTSSPEGLALLHKMQAALGGADKLAAANDFEETVKAQIWNNAGTPMGEVWKRIRWMRNPNILRVDQYGPRDTYVLFLNGRTDSGWEMLPQMRGGDLYKTAGEAIPLAGGELRFAKNYLTGFDLTMWLSDRNPGYVVTSPAANVLRIAHDGTASDTTLDPATWLPLKSNSVSLSDPNRPVPAEMRLDEWGVFDGIHLPTKRANYHSGAKLAEEVSQGPIRINGGLRPEELAAKPGDFAPVIPGR